MGRAPCCDKANVKKGPWSPEEDLTLKSHIEKNGTGGNWIALPQKIGLKRCGKSCRLRWLNYLRPNIKHGGFSEEEDNIICSLYISIGSRWSIIAAQLPGRTDNDIKNYWNTRLKKKLLGKQRKEQQARKASLRQEVKKEIPSFITPVVINQQPSYWPELYSATAVSSMPVLMNNPSFHSQEAHFLDQESLKSLLVKFGGRFSDNQELSNMRHTMYRVQDQQYANSVNMISSSPIDSTDTNYTVSNSINGAGADTSMFTGHGGFFTELDEFAVYNQAMEGLYGLDQIGNNSQNGANSGESSNCWGNNGNASSNYQTYPQLVAELESCLISLPQDNSSFEVSSYFGSQ